MSKKTFEIKVGKPFIRLMKDPFGEHNTTHALVNISDLPTDLPFGKNPRGQNIASRVAREIAHTIAENPERLHLLGRGMTLTVSETAYDTKTEMLTVQMPSDRYGVLDGGHTYAVICDHLNRAQEEKTDPAHAFVRMEIIEGLSSLELITDLAKARNTSAQVKDESLANVQGKFDWIREAVAKKPFAPLIAYRENSDSDTMPLGIREVVAFAFMMHPDFIESDTPPMDSYVSKGRCLEHFLNEANEKGYQQLRGVLADSLALYDYVHQQFEVHYRKIGGYSGIDESKGGGKKETVKLGKVREVEHRADGYDLYYLNGRTEYRFPDGWLYPVVAALRGLLSFGKHGNANAFWKADPMKYFDKYGSGLVKATLETSRNIGRNPNAVGKNKGHWTQLHDKVISQYLRLSKGDEHAIIDLE